MKNKTYSKNTEKYLHKMETDGLNEIGAKMFDKETIEEVAERILANNVDGLQELINDDDLFYFYKGVIKFYGVAMAEWQREQNKKFENELAELKNTVRFRAPLNDTERGFKQAVVLLYYKYFKR